MGDVPFVNLGSLLDDLKSWLTDDRPFAATVLSGRGGAGKTRLAVELCEQFAQKGWTCGMLRSLKDPTAFDALEELPSNALVVVDYAETRTSELKTLLPLLSDRSGYHSIRVLLLMRRPYLDPAGREDWLGWFRSEDDRLEALADQIDVRDVAAGQSESSAREDLYRAARVRFEQLSGASTLQLEAHEPDVLDETPLGVMMQAFLDAQPPDVNEQGIELLDRMLIHELRYWRRRSYELDGKLDDRMLELLVAVATLSAPKTREEAVDLLRVLPEFRDIGSERAHALAGWLNLLYPGEAFWNPLEPDLIGEHLVARSLGNLDVLGSLVAESRSQRPLIVLSRIEDDSAPLASEVLKANLNELDFAGLYALASQIRRGSAPDFVDALLKASTRFGSSWGNSIAELVADHTDLPISTRLSAVDYLAEAMSEGFPWRSKDWEDGDMRWRSDALGQRLLHFLDSHAVLTLDMLEGWLTDTRKVESHDGLTRRDIALALLATRPDALADRASVIVEHDLEIVRRWATGSAILCPDQVLPLAEVWADSSSELLQQVAVSALAATISRDRQRSVDGLRSLSLRTGQVRLAALSALAVSAPESPGVADEIIDAVASGNVDLWALLPYLESRPEAVLKILESRDQSGGLPLEILYWYPSNPVLDDRLLKVFSLSNPDERGYVAERAVNRLREGKRVPENRLDLALELLAKGPPSVRGSIFYALGQPSTNVIFEEFRRSALTALESSVRSVSEVSNLLQEYFKHASEDGWPEDWVLIKTLAGLTPAEASRACLLAVVSDNSGVAGQQVIRIHEANPQIFDEGMTRFRHDVLFGDDVTRAAYAQLNG